MKGGVQGTGRALDVGSFDGALAVGLRSGRPARSDARSELQLEVRARLPFGLRRPEVCELPQVVYYHVEAEALQIPGEPLPIRETRCRLDDVQAAVEFARALRL